MWGVSVLDSIPRVGCLKRKEAQEEAIALVKERAMRSALGKNLKKGGSEMSQDNHAKQVKNIKRVNNGQQAAFGDTGKGSKRGEGG